MSTRVALGVTVRDEARLLPAHLSYHHLLGVERAYVYLDEEGDSTLESVRHLDFVSAVPSVPAERFARDPRLAYFVERYRSHFAARQSLNVVDALDRAGRDGFDWLLSIDADELLCLDRKELVPDALPRALAAVSDRTDEILVPNLEVLQRRRFAGLPFREARLFKAPGGPRLPVRDPRDGEVAVRSWYFGHAAGKSLVRLGRGAVPAGSHHFVRPGGPPIRARSFGEVLHYYAYDFEDWYRRSRNFGGHPSHHLSGKAVEGQKLLWIDLVATMGREELADYYERTLVLPEPEVARLARRTWRRPLRRPCVVEVRSVARAFDDRPELKRY